MRWDTLVTVGVAVTTWVGSTMVAAWHTGNKLGSLSTEIKSLRGDIQLIRTNDLHHVEGRLLTIETILMERGRDAGKN